MIKNYCLYVKWHRIVSDVNKKISNLQKSPKRSQIENISDHESCNEGGDQKKKNLKNIQVT